MDRVFVYGSLMRGKPLNRAMKGARFLGEARTCEAYLLHVGWLWPLMIEHALQAAKRPVCGELYQVSPALLRRLDQVEDNGTLYQRETICVEAAGVRHEAWAYLAKDERLIHRALRRPAAFFDIRKKCYRFVRS